MGLREKRKYEKYANYENSKAGRREAGASGRGVAKPELGNEGNARTYGIYEMYGKFSGFLQGPARINGRIYGGEPAPMMKKCGVRITPEADAS